MEGWTAFATIIAVYVAITLLVYVCMGVRKYAEAIARWEDEE